MMNPKPLIYLAAPYTHDNPDVVRSRVEVATQVAGELIGLGWRVFSPITYTHPFANDYEPPDGWYAFDLDFLARCDVLVVLMLPGWWDSTGVRMEIDYAQDKGMKIHYISTKDVGRFEELLNAKPH